MVFTRRIIYFPLLPVIIQNKSISFSTTFKFLGVVLDFKLNWKAHIQRIQSKLSSACGIMYRLRNKVPRSVARLLYFSIAYAYLNYCNSIWSSCSTSVIQQLFVTQKKLIRFMMKKRRLEPSTPLFKRLRILKLPEIIKLNTAIFVFKSVNNLIPSPINYEFRVQRHYNLRRGTQLNIPFARSKQTQRFLHIRGAHLWNELPQELRENRTLISFKLNLKKYFLLSYDQWVVLCTIYYNWFCFFQVFFVFPYNLGCCHILAHYIWSDCIRSSHIICKLHFFIFLFFMVFLGNLTWDYYVRLFLWFVRTLYKKTKYFVFFCLLFINHAKLLA